MASLALRISLLERDCEASLGELEFAYLCQQERCKEYYRMLVAEEHSRTEVGIKEQAEGARTEAQQSTAEQRRAEHTTRKPAGLD